MTVRFFVVRHGERQDAVSSSWIGIANRPHDPPLTERGWDMGRLLGEYLRNGSSETPAVDPNDDDILILSSPLTRCIQTADGIIKGLGNASIPIYVAPALCENPQYMTKVLKLPRCSENGGKIFDKLSKGGLRGLMRKLWLTPVQHSENVSPHVVDSTHAILCPFTLGWDPVKQDVFDMPFTDRLPERCLYIADTLIQKCRLIVHGGLNSAAVMMEQNCHPDTVPRRQQRHHGNNGGGVVKNLVIILVTHLEPAFYLHESLLCVSGNINQPRLRRTSGPGFTGWGEVYRDGTTGGMLVQREGLVAFAEPPPHLL